METVEFEQVIGHGCCIDVHKKTVVATINGEGLKRSTREFGTFTSSLTELKDWLLENGITHVAMESTGVYWKPVYHVLEPSRIKVWIVNARHVKNVPGHKTDKKDSAWLCKLLLAGLLKPSLYSPKRTARASRPDQLPQEIGTRHCLQQEPHHPHSRRLQRETLQRAERYKRCYRHQADRQTL
jgi:transposase